MATASPTLLLHPVQNLRTQATKLEAALSVARAEPTGKPVHTLRTATRRIEAQLALLSLLPGLPDHAAPSRKLNRLLQKLRRAAGAVRDLDVQRDALDSFRHGSGDQPDAAADLPDIAAARASAIALRKRLKSRRQKAVDHLRHTLKQHGPTLTIRLEDLLSAVDNADPTLAPEELGDRIRSWYHQELATRLREDATPNPPHATANGSGKPSADGRIHLPKPAPSTPDLSHLTADQLHTIRKVAKLARYLAESAEEPSASASHPYLPPPLDQLAARFHALQQTGGEWHDALTLAELAHHERGKHDPLTETLTHTRDRLLHTFQQHLTTFRP